MKVPEIRTIQQAYRDIVMADSHSAITIGCLRKAVVNGDIPSIMRGNKYLVDMENVRRYFSCEQDVAAGQGGSSSGHKNVRRLY